MSKASIEKFKEISDVSCDKSHVWRQKLFWFLKLFFKRNAQYTSTFVHVLGWKPIFYKKGKIIGGYQYKL